MPTFTYIARDSRGKRTDGTLDAADRNSALLLLQQKGHTPLSLSAEKKTVEKSSSPKARLRASFKMSTGQKTKMKPREMLLFTRELADLLTSGMTLGRALHTQAKRDTNPNSVIIKRLDGQISVPR